MPQIPMVSPCAMWSGSAEGNSTTLGMCTNQPWYEKGVAAKPPIVLPSPERRPAPERIQSCA